MDEQYMILIADDHPLFRNALCQSIRMGIHDAHLFEADSLESLLKKLKQESDIDLLLLDLKMPDANGISGLLQLRQQYPELPIVVISASEEAVTIHQVNACGALGFIPKSSEMHVLINALKQVLAGNTYFPQTDNETQSDETHLLLKRIASLTPQQCKVLYMLNDGLLNKQIAHELAVSEATIKAHMTAIFRKLKVRNRTQAVILLQQVSPLSLPIEEKNH